MSKLHKLMVAWVMIFPALLQAQTLDDVLKQVEANNKSLMAERQRIEAARVEFRTGLTLYDPQVSYDYMIGRPETAGNQTDVTINQAFDFPTAYSGKRRVANLKTEKNEFEQQLIRRQILLEAKLISVGIIYGNRKKAELTRRQEQAQKFYRDYQTKFDNKDATVLDLNKARLQLAGIQADLKLLDTELAAKNQRLVEMNGGKEIQLTDFEYPLQNVPTDFEAMFLQIEETDPLFKFYSKQKEIGDAQVNLSKSLWLPKVEAGYHYQGILGQRFSGTHIGLNIPLWEKRNTVNFQRQQSMLFELQLQNHHNEHYHLLKQLYDKAQALEANLESYQKELQQLNSTELLGKALLAGEISTLEYFLELSVFYQSVDKLLQLELAFNETLTELMRHEL